MRREALLPAIGYAATVGAATAMLGVLTATDFGTPRNAPHVPDVPMPSITVPQVPAVRAEPTDGAPRRLIVTASATIGPSLPSPSAPPVSPPSAPPTDDPRAPAPTATTGPDPNGPEPTAVPDDDVTSGKPRPCGLVLDPPALCGTMSGHDP